MVDVPLRHPVPQRPPSVPARTPSVVSRAATISSSIFPHAPGHEPSRGRLPLGDGSLGRTQDSSDSIMIAIPEQMEDPTTAPDVPPSLPRPTIQQRRDVPTPLQVSVPDPESVVDSCRRQPNGSGPGSALFQPNGQVSDRLSPLRRSTVSDQIELTHVFTQSPTNLNTGPQSPQGESQPSSRPNSLTSDIRSRNGTYSPGRRVRDSV